MKLAARLTAAVDADGTQLQLIVTRPGCAFRTGASGSPANSPAYDRLLDGGNFDRSIASNGPNGARLLFGRLESSFGDASIENTDGAFDFLAECGTAGFLYELFALDDAGATQTAYESFPAAWEPVFTAKMVAVVSDGQVLRVRLRDAFDGLDRPLCPRFAGTGGAEGDATLAGTPKPVVLGGCLNVEPALVDAQRLMYIVSGVGAVSGHHAKDMGSVVARALTAGAQELNAAADYASLWALAVPRGHYATCTDDSAMKFGTKPVGQLTCDAVSYRYGVPRLNPSDVILDTAEAANIDGFSYDALAITQLWDWCDSWDAKVGFYAKDDSTTYADALSAICASIGAWCGFDREGVFTARRVVDPAGESSVMTIRADEMIGIRLTTTGDAGRGVPYARIIQRYPRNWTVQTSGLAGVVPPEVRSQLAERFPKSVTTECTQTAASSPFDAVPITQQFVGAQDYVVETYSYARRITSTGDLDAADPAPASVFTDTVGVPRRTFDVEIPMTVERIQDADIGDVITLDDGRYTESGGEKFLVLGIRYRSASSPSLTYTLWG